MPTTLTLPTPDGGEADIEVTPMNLGLGLAITAVRPPVSPPPAGFPAPVGYWPFDSALTDASGNGHHLTGASATYAAAKFGQGVQTNGTAAASQTLLSGPVGAGPWSLAFWAPKPGMFQGTQVQLTYANASSAVVLQVSGSFSGVGASGQVIRKNGSITAVSVTPTLADGQHHFALVNDGTTLTLYIDGAAVGTANPAGVTDAFEAFGQVAANTNFVTLDDAAVWDVALTAEQVAAVAAAAGDLSTLL